MINAGVLAKPNGAVHELQIGHHLTVINDHAKEGGLPLVEQLKGAIL